MNTFPTSYRVSRAGNDPCQYGVSDMSTNSTTSNVYGYSNSNIGNVLHSNNNTINVGVSEEFLRIQAWLSPLEPHSRHQDVSNRRLDGVGDWVLQKNEFESWRDGRDGEGNPTLLCYGGQGVGKTYISSLVIDTLCAQTCEQNIAVLSLYCDYQAQKDQTAVNMVGGLLKQVVAGEAGIPGEVRRAFEGLGQRGGKSLRLPDMLKLFVGTMSSFERVFICFDAVDELLPQHRSGFLRAVRQIIQDTPNTRLFLTGRPYIRQELDKHLAVGAYIIHILADQGDIGRYISQKMDEDDDRDPDLMTENLKNDIIKTLCEKSSEMFLLVALNIDAILGETSLAKRKEMLRKVATTGVDLDSVYAQTLQRIREQKGDRSRLGMEVLMWASYAARPLRIDELRHALAVEMGDRGLDPDNIRPQDTVLGSCLGLAMVDHETSNIRLIHYTLQEYLSRPGILPDAHKTLSQTCLAYLNFEQFKGLTAMGAANFELFKGLTATGAANFELFKALTAMGAANFAGMPFLEYSSLYWGFHAKAELSDHGKSLALKLLNRFDDHISVTLLLNQTYLHHHCLLINHIFPGLHGASYFGVAEVLEALIEMGGCDINQRDCTGFTPLMWAAREGNEEVVKLLLSRDDVNPNISDGVGRLPLSWASEGGHEGVVRLLLSREDIDPHQADLLGLTPLWWAVAWGRVGVVRLFLARGGINPDNPTSMANAALLGCIRFI